MTGTVKWFDERKGFGFITSEDGQDIFVHYTSIQADGFKNLNEGDEVEFEINETDRGPQASNVVKRWDKLKMKRDFNRSLFF